MEPEAPRPRKRPRELTEPLEDSMGPPHSNLNSLTDLGFSQESIRAVPERYASSPDQAAEYLLSRKRQGNEHTETSKEWHADSQGDAPTSSATSFEVTANSGLANPSQSNWNGTINSSSYPDKDTVVAQNAPIASAGNQTEDQQLQEAMRLSKQDFERKSLQSGQGDGVPLLLASDQNELELQRVLAESAREQKVGNATAFQDEDPRKRRRESLSDPVGLCNIGNTCYLNSLLQLYFNLDDFRRSILSFSPPPSQLRASAVSGALPPLSHDASKQQVTEQSSSQGVMIDFVIELQRLFGLMALGNQKFANPKDLFEVMQRCGHNISLGNQEDAQEFAFKLLEIAEKAAEVPVDNDVKINQNPQISNDVPTSDMSLNSQVPSDGMDNDASNVASSNKVSPPTAVQSAASHVYQSQPSKQEQNFVKDIFTLKVQYETKLDPQGPQQQEYAQTIRRTKPDGVLSSFPGYEPSVLVSINGLSDQDIYDGLDDFTHQTLDYRWDPGNEQPKSVQAVKRMLFTKVPPVLTVWLKRHTYNRESGAGKAETKFLFHERIALDRYLNENRAVADAVRHQVRSIQKRRKDLKQRWNQISQFGVAEAAQFTASGTSGKGPGDDLIVALRRASLRIQSTVDDNKSEMFVDAVPKAQVEDAVALLKRIIKSDETKCLDLQNQIAGLDDAERKAYSNLQNTKYRLQAVLIHEGAGSGGGHYWTYIRNRCAEENSKRWIKFNDRIVSYVSEEEMWTASLGGKGRPSSAYCIVYTRYLPSDTVKPTKDDMEIVRQDIADEARELLPAERLSEITKRNKDFERELQEYEKKLEAADIDDVARRLLSVALSKAKEGSAPSVPMTASSSSIGGSLNEWKDVHCLKNVVVFLSAIGSTTLAIAQALAEVWDNDPATGEEQFFARRAEDVRMLEFPHFNSEPTPVCDVSRPSRILHSLVSTIASGPGCVNWPSQDTHSVTPEACTQLGLQLQSVAGMDSLITELQSHKYVYLITLCGIRLQSAALDASLKGDWMNALEFWNIVFRASFTSGRIPGVPESELTKAASEFKNNPSLEFARSGEQNSIFMGVLIAASETAVALLMEQNEDGTALGIKAAQQIMLFSVKTEMPYKTLVQVWEEVSVRWANDPRQKLGHRVAGEILRMLRTADNSVSVDQKGMTSPETVEKMNAVMEEATKDPEGTVKEYELLLNQMHQLNPQAKDSNGLRRIAERIRLNTLVYTT